MAGQGKTDGTRAKPGQPLRISARNHNAWSDAADRVAITPLTPLGGTLRTPHAGQAGVYGRNTTASTLVRGQVMNLGDLLSGDDLGSMVFELETFTAAGNHAICNQVIAASDVGLIAVGGGGDGSLIGVFVRDATVSSTACILDTDGVFEASASGTYPILAYISAVTGGAMCIVDTSRVVAGGDFGGAYRGEIKTQGTSPSYTVTLDVIGDVTAINMWERDVPPTVPSGYVSSYLRIAVGQGVVVNRDSTGYFFYALPIRYYASS